MRGPSFLLGLGNQLNPIYDWRALATTTAPQMAGARLQPVAVVTISVVLLATVIVAVAALGTTILGVPTTYASGLDAGLGAQVVSDFMTDQNAEAAALSSGDQSILGGHLTDSALSDVVQQISNQSAAGSQPAVTFHPASLTILRAADPADPSLTIEVQEEGTKTVVTSNGLNAAPTEQTVGFHGDFWLRIPSGTKYAIADQHIQIQPSSPLPGIATTLAAVLVIGLAASLFVRQRGRRPSSTMATSGDPIPGLALIESLGDGTSALPHGPPADMVVTTFGGLHVRQGGVDWAQALMSRPVTGFVWLRLLVGAVRNPATPVGREEVARQASPGLSRDVQLKRLRNVIAKGLREMPSVLRDRILVKPEVMSFNLDGCEVDAIELLRLTDATGGRRELSSADAAHIQRVLSACRGTFLPEFDTIEDLATDRHPTCTEIMREIRDSLTNKRVELALLLANSHLRAGRPAPAIAILEPALVDRGERKDIADRLATAYRAAGREAEAKALEARYV